MIKATSVELPTHYTPVGKSLPDIGKTVKCFMSNGTETKGHRYENPFRGGWMTMYANGLYANQIWSGITVLGWKEIN